MENYPVHISGFKGLHPTRLGVAYFYRGHYLYGPAGNPIEPQLYPTKGKLKVCGTTDKAPKYEYDDPNLLSEESVSALLKAQWHAKLHGDAIDEYKDKTGNGILEGKEEDNGEIGDTHFHQDLPAPEIDLPSFHSTAVGPRHVQSDDGYTNKTDSTQLEEHLAIEEFRKIAAAYPSRSLVATMASTGPTPEQVNNDSKPPALMFSAQHARESPKYLYTPHDRAHYLSASTPGSYSNTREPTPFEGWTGSLGPLPSTTLELGHSPFEATHRADKLAIPGLKSVKSAPGSILASGASSPNQNVRGEGVQPAALSRSLYRLVHENAMSKEHDKSVTKKNVRFSTSGEKDAHGKDLSLHSNMALNATATLVQDNEDEKDENDQRSDTQSYSQSSSNCSTSLYPSPTGSTVAEPKKAGKKRVSFASNEHIGAGTLDRVGTPIQDTRLPPKPRGILKKSSSSNSMSGQIIIPEDSGTIPSQRCVSREQSRGLAQAGNRETSGANDGKALLPTHSKTFKNASFTLGGDEPVHSYERRDTQIRDNEGRPITPLGSKAIYSTPAPSSSPIESSNSSGRNQQSAAHGGNGIHAALYGETLVSDGLYGSASTSGLRDLLAFSDCTKSLPKPSSTSLSKSPFSMDLRTKTGYSPGHDAPFVPPDNQSLSLLHDQSANAGSGTPQPSSQNHALPIQSGTTVGPSPQPDKQQYSFLHGHRAANNDRLKLISRSLRSHNVDKDDKKTKGFPEFIWRPTNARPIATARENSIARHERASVALNTMYNRTHPLPQDPRPDFDNTADYMYNSVEECGTKVTKCTIHDGCDGTYTAHPHLTEQCRRGRGFLEVYPMIERGSRTMIDWERYVREERERMVEEGQLEEGPKGN